MKKRCAGIDDSSEVDQYATANARAHCVACRRENTCVCSSGLLAPYSVSISMMTKLYFNCIQKRKGKRKTILKSIYLLENG